MSNVFILDTSLLGNAFACDPKIGVKILNSIKVGHDSIIVPDQVRKEVTRAPFKDHFDKWMKSNGIQETITPTGQAALAGAKIDDAGEKAIVDIVEGRAGNIKSGSQITIGADDLAYFRKGLGKPYLSNTVQIQDVANNAVAAGSLTRSEYRSLMQNPRIANSNSRSNVTTWHNENEIPLSSGTRTLNAAGTAMLGIDGGIRVLHGNTKTDRAVGVIEFGGSTTSAALQAAGKFDKAGEVGVVVAAVSSVPEIYEAGKQASANGQNVTRAVTLKTAEAGFMIGSNLGTLGMVGNAPNIISKVIEEHKFNTQALGEALKQTTPVLGYHGAIDVYNNHGVLAEYAKYSVKDTLGLETKPYSQGNKLEEGLIRAAEIGGKLAAKGCGADDPATALSSQYILNKEMAKPSQGKAS